MKLLGTTLEERLRRAGILILVGFLVELLSLSMLETPAGFLLFAIGGGSLLGLGILLYLWSLVARTDAVRSE